MKQSSLYLAENVTLLARDYTHLMKSLSTDSFEFYWQIRAM